MTISLIILLVVLGINFICVLGYWLWNLPSPKRTDKKSVWICGIIMLFCPVIGICFFSIAHLWYRAFFFEPVDLDGVIFSKERVRTYIRADEENERNMVPLEEAIEIEDTENLRNLMMNIVKGDITHSLASIALALNSEDTETAHYAASVLQDAINDFRNNVHREHKKIKERRPDMAVSAARLIDSLDQVLVQHVLTDVEQKDYVAILDDVCEELYEVETERMTSSQFEAVTLRLLEIKDYEKCQKWCERAVYRFPNTLATYTCQLKYFFSSGQKERFFEVLEELKKSSIVIDSETLELIRAFRQ